LTIPENYEDRGQSLIKHLVLRDYLASWGFKLGSTARGRRAVTRLWYIDCFAGPWRADDETLDGTSVKIGLNELAKVLNGWRKKGVDVSVSAIFIESNPRSFKKLEAFLDNYRGPVVCHAFKGKFGERIDDIRKLIGQDAAFLFVDPTGWRGAEMNNIRQLLTVPRRDVMINVMFNFINRFIPDGREAIRKSLMDFFGVEENELPADLDEDGLMKFYRDNLKKKCRVAYSADLFVQHPDIDRTWFRLVIGGGNAEVVRLFRDVERKVIGKQSAEIRDEAKRKKRETKSGQGELDLQITGMDRRYSKYNCDGKIAAEKRLVEILRTRGECKYQELWPEILEEFHITFTDLNTIVSDMRRRRVIEILEWKPKQRSPAPSNVLFLTTSDSTAGM